MFLFLFLFLETPQVKAETYEKLQPTEINAAPVNLIGTKEVTRPIQTVSGEELQAQDRYQITDGFNTLPGVQARLEGGPLISIRGSQSTARTLVIQDGIPLNFADGAGFNPMFLTTENLGGAALLLGPASALFGHDAMTGVIELNSEKLKKNKFFMSRGSFNTNKIFLGTPVESGPIHSQVTVYQTHNDGDYPFQMPRISYSGTRSRNDSETIRGTVQTSNTSLDIPLNSTNAPVFYWKAYELLVRQIGSTPDTPIGGFPQSFNNWGQLSNLQMAYELSGQTKISLNNSYKLINQQYDDIPYGRTTSFNSGINLSQKISEYSFNIFDDFTNERFEVSSFTDGAKSQALNEFGASAQIPISENILSQPALRFSSEDGGVIPSIGFTGYNEDRWKIFLNYSQGYRPGSISDKYYKSISFTGNPNLQPEQSKEIDLGVEKNIPLGILKFEAFSRDLTNLIENRYVAPNVLSPQNVGRAHATGFEGQFAGKTPIADPALNISYLENKNLDASEPVILSPQFQISLTLVKIVGSCVFSVEDTQWSDYYDRDLSNQLVGLGGWNTLDARIKYYFAKDLFLRLSAMNILDQPRELHFGFPESKRNLTLTLGGYF